MEPKIDRKRTLTMNFAALGEVEDDDDRFFETYDRRSTAAPFDLGSSSSDEDDFDDCRISFASTASSAGAPRRSVVGRPSDFNGLGMPDYNMWMAAPDSIRERRNKLFQGFGMGSNNSGNANWISFKKKGASKKNVSNVANIVNVKVDGNSDGNANIAVAVTIPVPVEASPAPNVVTAADQANPKVVEEIQCIQSPVYLVKSRSDGDIEALSIEKARKHELLGSVSKHRLTRTSSLLINSTRICPYRDTVRASPNPGNGKGNGGHTRCLTPVMSNGRFGAVFLIKNLDTGKEFIVKEYGEDGMWNKLSDLQTGKQLTMDEFEKCVGYSPVVKELMRRQNVRGMHDDKKLLGSNYLSKSIRGSKRRGAALLKNIKGVANSMNLRHEKEKEGNGSTPVPSVPEPKEKKNSTNEWVKVRQTGKAYKELSALHLCQEIQAHEGAIWILKFSLDGKYLASAGEDKTIQVWEAQECEILSMGEGNLTPIHQSMCGSSGDKPSLGEACSMPSEKRKKGKGAASKRGSSIPDYVHVPETVLLLSEKPVCSFQGHQDDVLDLSWSRSQLLLSSSMDKTVRLWDLESKTCLKLFAHNDYVTCIHFNPMDDNYFISGSLDAKVRIWSIPNRQVIDWSDLHEMVTAACYTPDGQGAVIGTHKGSCRMFSTEDGKLSQLHQMEIQNKKKGGKKVTGFQFSPVSPTEYLVTSADSRIRILDGTDVIHKFRGFRNTSSQIPATFSLDGKYVISASEDSQVFVWKCEEQRQPANGKARTIINTQAHEHFPCRDVSVAIAWPGTVKGEPPAMSANTKKKRGGSISQPASDCTSPTKEETPAVNNKKKLPPLPKKKAKKNTAATTEEDSAQVDPTESGISESSMTNPSAIQSGDPPLVPDATPSLPDSSSINFADPAPSLSNSASIKNGDQADDSPSKLSDSTPSTSSSSSIKAGDSPSISATSTLQMSNSSSIKADDSSSAPSISNSSSIKAGDSPAIPWPSSWSWLDVIGNMGNQNVQASAWGLVIVTATVGGEIRIYQNFGLPRRGGRQAGLF